MHKHYHFMSEEVTKLKINMKNYKKNKLLVSGLLSS